MKETNNANGNNVADQIQALENLVSKDHKFVRTIIRDKNKMPTIILYNDEQILDIKNLCCTGQFWLCWGLTTRQPLRVILCRLPEKGRKEIEERVEEMKERDREERETGMKVKKQKK